MRTILNVALGLALAFCLIFLVSGEFEKYVDKKVEAALVERLGTVEQDAPAEEVATEEVKQTSVVAKKVSKPADNRQYIDVRGPKGNVKLYVGQPKDEVLQMLGTPDSFDFGGTYEDCSYTVGSAIMPNLKIEFERGKLKNIRKYNY
ncbi:MAG: hypothetical protein IJN01_05315 [Rikenellaceae bacterium]|nr:hypothetical protein [Rikenellaceae bacterium]